MKSENDGGYWRGPPTKDETLKEFRRITDLRKLRQEQIDIKQLADGGHFPLEGLAQEVLDIIRDRIKQLESLDAAAIAELKAAEEAEDRAEAQAQLLRRPRAKTPRPNPFLDDLIEVDREED